MSAKRYRYTGKERDEETGLYYHGARYYAAWLGRWVSCDPIILETAQEKDRIAQTKLQRTMNSDPYSYALNNPPKFIDPDGRQADRALSEINKIVDVTSTYFSPLFNLPPKMQPLFKKALFEQLRMVAKESGQSIRFIAAALGHLERAGVKHIPEVVKAQAQSALSHLEYLKTYLDMNPQVGAGIKISAATSLSLVFGIAGSILQSRKQYFASIVSNAAGVLATGVAANVAKSAGLLSGGTLAAGLISSFLGGWAIGKSLEELAERKYGIAPSDWLANKLLEPERRRAKLRVREHAQHVETMSRLEEMGSLYQVIPMELRKLNEALRQLVEAQKKGEKFEAESMKKYERMKYIQEHGALPP